MISAFFKILSVAVLLTGLLAIMVIKNISELRKIISSISNKIIYYVPTMGNLHEGHLQLIKYALEKKQFLVVSIYVNPLQFDSITDYKKYPRTIKRDLKILEKLNVDIIFLPEIIFKKIIFQN